MSETTDTSTEKPGDRELTITRVFDAPRHLVFEAWTREEHLAQWFMADQFTFVEFRADLRPGGLWRSAMVAPDGESFKAGGVYREIVPNERLVFTHAWEGDDGQPEHETIVSVTLADHATGATLMTFKQAFFKSVESRDRHNGGWGQFFDHLEDHLAAVAA